ncbi:hypothetical protein KSP40_PGU020192 [Platanthera guangdongensis]|uniref:3-deoxy-D-manno-octulosonic-acid transferase N-terminal domain-containing protein n=1 Tax=Platanthera guangdongensis TaxID=2320717 RepID=A0ABR2N4P2_9ASPA
MAGSGSGSGSWGRAVYEIYRVASRAISPLLYLHVHWRRLRGLEHWSRWPERFGRPSARRPPGTLIWFHAVSLGEGLAAIPVINHCLQKNPNLLVLMTTTTVSAFEVIKERLPSSVIYQFAPVDTPMAMENFLVYWTPVAVILMESELWPNLIISASRKGISVALLNARMSYKSFRRWSLKISFPLISLMLSKFSLIVALSTAEAIRFQLLNAPPFIIHFAGDLKYAVGNLQLSQNECKSITRLKLQLYKRPVWMAASIHRGEEEVVISVHKELTLAFPNLVTILVTRNPQHGRQLAQALHKKGMHVALRTKTQMVSSSVNLYVVDTLEILQLTCHVTVIFMIQTSFILSLRVHKHNAAQAPGCSNLTECSISNFDDMVVLSFDYTILSPPVYSPPLSVLIVLDKPVRGHFILLLSSSLIFLEYQKAFQTPFNSKDSVIIKRVKTHRNFSPIKREVILIFEGLYDGNPFSILRTASEIRNHSISLRVSPK